MTPGGTMDMGGNVAEWCRDSYSAVFYANSPPEDPVCTKTTQERVVRGASFSSTKIYALRAATRESARATTSSGTKGFRCVLP